MPHHGTSAAPTTVRHHQPSQTPSMPPSLSPAGAGAYRYAHSHSVHPPNAFASIPASLPIAATPRIAAPTCRRRRRRPARQPAGPTIPGEVVGSAHHRPRRQRGATTAAAARATAAAASIRTRAAAVAWSRRRPGLEGPLRLNVARRRSAGRGDDSRWRRRQLLKGRELRPAEAALTAAVIVEDGFGGDVRVRGRSPHRNR